jgi:hypothetical protein
MKIYVASSRRNTNQNMVVSVLRESGHDVYDFKNPKQGDFGFHWSSIDPNWKHWGPEEFVKSLRHPVAESGFQSDFDAIHNRRS